MFVIPAEWIKVLATLIVTGAGYWASVQFLAPRWAALARAARPGEAREAADELDWQLAAR